MSKSRVASYFFNRYISVAVKKAEELKSRARVNPRVLYLMKKDLENFTQDMLPVPVDEDGAPIMITRGYRNSLYPILNIHYNLKSELALKKQLSHFNGDAEFPGLFYHMDGDKSPVMSWTTCPGTAANFSCNYHLPIVREGSVVYANIPAIYLDISKFGNYANVNDVLRSQHKSGYQKYEDNECPQIDCDDEHGVPHPNVSEKEVGVISHMESPDIRMIVPTIGFNFFSFASPVVFIYRPGVFMNPAYANARSYSIGIASLEDVEVLRIEKRMRRAGDLTKDMRLITYNEAKEIAKSLAKLPQYEGLMLRHRFVPSVCTTIKQVVRYAVLTQRKYYLAQGKSPFLHPITYKPSLFKQVKPGTIMDVIKKHKPIQ